MINGGLNIRQIIGNCVWRNKPGVGKLETIKKFSAFADLAQRHIDKNSHASSCIKSNVI